MLRRHLCLSILTMVVFLGLQAPLSAAGQNTRIGGGYWQLPNFSNLDDEGNIIEDAFESEGYYASIQVQSGDGIIEIDYSFDEPTFFAIVYDYLYPLMGSGGSYGGRSQTSSYVGMGYTYMYSEDLDDENGFNVMVGFSLGSQWFASARYDILGSDKDLLTLGIYFTTG